MMKWVKTTFGILLSVLLCWMQLSMAQEPSSDSNTDNTSLQELEQKVEQVEQIAQEQDQDTTEQTENKAAEPVVSETPEEVSDDQKESLETLSSETQESENDRANVAAESPISDDNVEQTTSGEVVSTDSESEAQVSEGEPVSDDVVKDDDSAESTVSDDDSTNENQTENIVSDDVVTDDDVTQENQAEAVSDDAIEEETAAELKVVSDDDPVVRNGDEIVNPKFSAKRSGISTQVVCSDVCRDEKTGLPIRVLPRPFSNIYTDQDSEGIVVENVETFKPWYVKQRLGIDLSDGTNPKGWYQVSKSVKEEPTGWMKAADVLEWHQALVMAYTHPGDLEEEQRSRVLMFSSVEDLKGLVENDERKAKTAEYSEMLLNGEVPDGVISKEPEGYVSITDKFYMLPILDYDQVSIEGDDTMYLQVAAAVSNVRGAIPLGDLIKDPLNDPKKLKSVPVDVVFVMDMTASMQPYIDTTKEAIKQLSQRLVETKDSSMIDRIRFGLVGYRDSIELVPDLEFVSKNFTPDLVDSNGLTSVLDTDAKAATVSSKGYAEDVFSGIATAINDTAWNEDSLKIMILIGDSSGHLPGEKGASSEHAEEDLRQLANDRGIHLISVHMNDQKHQEDAVTALKQYSVLSRTAGSEYKHSLVSMDSTVPDSFQRVATTLGNKIDGKLKEIAEGKINKQPEGAVNEEPKTIEEEAAAAYDKAFNAALVEYLGKASEPPRDLTAWVWDRDLKDPTIKALDVRVLLSKAQLNDMAINLKDIRGASFRAEKTSQDFFVALKAVAAQASKDPEKLAKATNLVDAGLLPSFIETLPYKSDVLSMSDDQFAQMSAEERSQLDQSLRQKIAHYETISSSDNGWVSFNDTDPLNDQVYPLSINMLP